MALLGINRSWVFIGGVIWQMMRAQSRRFGERRRLVQDVRLLVNGQVSSWIIDNSERASVRDPAGGRDVGLDVGRCIAAFAVICIHTAGPYLNLFHADLLWNTANIINGASRFCVPIFVIMSGALILGRPVDSWTSFMRRRCTAILKPYAFGAAIYLAWNVLYNGTYPSSVLSYIRLLVGGVPEFHLYFFWLILGMYIVTPFLDLDRIKTRILIFTTVFIFAIFAVQRLIVGYGFNFGMVQSVSSYLPYYISGYIMAKRVKVPLWAALSGYILSTAFTIGTMYFASREAGLFSGTMVQEYDSFNVVIQALSLMGIVQNIHVKDGLIRRAIHGLAALSLGIFVIHFAILSMILDFTRHFQLIGGDYEALTFPFLTFAVSAVIVKTLHMAPRLRGWI